MLKRHPKSMKPIQPISSNEIVQNTTSRLLGHYSRGISILSPRDFDDGTWGSAWRRQASWIQTVGEICTWLVSVSLVWPHLFFKRISTAFLQSVSWDHSNYMAPRNRVGRFKGRATTQASSSTQAVNTSSFPALADEIYLEVLLYIPAVPIPSATDSPLYSELCRSRHETLLSLSQTSHSLRRFFWRYLWQHIEVCEGMKIRDEHLPRINQDIRTHRKYNAELVCQLEIVTIRNPQLAQHVKSVLIPIIRLKMCSFMNSYLDIFIADYSFDTVIAELARCLRLFSNLHMVQIKVASDSKRSLHKIFARTFKDYSYPQIRDVSVMVLSQSFIASCPEARHVNFINQWTRPPPETDPMAYLDLITNNCPRLEVLENPPQILETIYGCQHTILYLFFPVFQKTNSFSSKASSIAFQIFELLY